MTILLIFLTWYYKMKIMMQDVIYFRKMCMSKKEILNSTVSYILYIICQSLSLFANILWNVCDCHPLSLWYLFFPPLAHLYLLLPFASLTFVIILYLAMELFYLKRMTHSWISVLGAFIYECTFQEAVR